MSKESDIEDAIVRYCAAHPHAADSVDGVRRCWLTDSAVANIDVQHALEALVKRGVLTVRPLPDGTALYVNRRTR